MQARRTLIAQRRDQIRTRAVLDGRWERAWARFTGLTLGYGYQPWRALLVLLATAGVSVALAVVLGQHGALIGPGAGRLCSLADQVGTGLDLGLPLIKTGAQAHCSVTDTAAGTALTVGGWGLQLASWAFATLFVAGFTGAVRKT